MPTQLERLAILETQLATVLARVESNTGKLDSIHDLVQQGHGAAKAARWVGHGVTAAIAFGVSQLGGALHLPFPRP
jgi:hypothetical protein